MNEKEKDIRLLLGRFMAGETSLEEEALIGEWFRQHPDVSDDLKEYQMMFGYFDEGMPLEESPDFFIFSGMERLASVDFSSWTTAESTSSGVVLPSS